MLYSHLVSFLGRENSCGVELGFAGEGASWRSFSILNEVSFDAILREREREILCHAIKVQIIMQQLKKFEFE